MGTKNNPGEYDCYAKLADDEPYFLLRAKDIAAHETVRKWVEMRRQFRMFQSPFGVPTPKQEAKLQEAMKVAEAMNQWFHENLNNNADAVSPMYQCAGGEDCHQGDMEPIAQPAEDMGLVMCKADGAALYLCSECIRENYQEDSGPGYHWTHRTMADDIADGMVPPTAFYGCQVCEERAYPADKMNEAKTTCLYCTGDMQ